MKTPILSFRITLTLLIWAAALIPALVLSVRHFEGSYNQLFEANKQMLIEKVSFTIERSRVALKDSIEQLDDMATDGSIIAAASMDVMSVRALTKMEAFIQRQPMYKSIMIIAPDLFQTEVIPSKSLAMNITPFHPFLLEVLNSPESITNPEPRYFAVKKSDVLGAGASESGVETYYLAIVRPILKPKESMTKPFEVVSVLFAVAEMPDIISGMLSRIDKTLDNVQLEVKLQDETIFSSIQGSETGKEVIHEHEVSVGDNPPFQIKIIFNNGVQMQLSTIIFQKNGVFVYTLLLLLFILPLVLFLTRQLVRPVHDLKRLTESIGEADVTSRTPMKVKGGSYFREFHEVYLLLNSMSKTIADQFNLLTAKNNELETTTKALRRSVTSGEQHHEILNELMRFSLRIQHEKSINKVGQATLKLIFLIIESPVGIVIYRNRSHSGFASIEKSPSAFQQFITNKEGYSLTNEEIEQISDDSYGFQLEPIAVDNDLRGYLIFRASEVKGFTLRALNMLIMILRAYLYQRDLTYKLEIQANTDALTGLGNRHFFDTKFLQFQQAFTSAVIKKEHFAVMVIDINGLKVINDSFGHSAGDKLIKRVGELLSRTFRKSDIVARVGGDEFIVLLSDVNSPQCERWITEINLAATKETIQEGNESFGITFSCGYACTDDTPSNLLVSIADKNMYKEKVRFKNSQR